jgi:hypothetical protein
MGPLNMVQIPTLTLKIYLKLGCYEDQVKQFIHTFNEVIKYLLYARHCSGIDLGKLSAKGHLGFVDHISSLLQPLNCCILLK